MVTLPPASVQAFGVEFRLPLQDTRGAQRDGRLRAITQRAHRRANASHWRRL